MIPGSLRRRLHATLPPSLRRLIIALVWSRPQERAVRQAFRTVYDRAPGEAELPALRFVRDRGARSLHGLLRSVIGSFDRQTLPTPLIIRFGSEDVAYVPLEEYELAIDTADTSVGIPLLQSRRYEPHLTALFRRYIRPGMTVVDIGANIGYYTLLSSKLVGETGQVFAFEPNSENCRLILLSLNRNRVKNVNLIPTALSDRAGHAFFSAHVGSNGGLLSPEEATLLSSGCTVVPTMRLTDALSNVPAIDFLKVDVEGAEGLVFAGAYELIERCRPIIVFELSGEMLPRVSGSSPRQLLQSLADRKYRLHYLDHDSGQTIPIENVARFTESLTGDNLNQNVVAIPEEKSKAA